MRRGTQHRLSGSAGADERAQPEQQAEQHVRGQQGSMPAAISPGALALFDQHPEAVLGSAIETGHDPSDLGVVRRQLDPATTKGPLAAASSNMPMIAPGAVGDWFRNS